MEYVADLETIERLFVDGLRQADVPIIDRSRLEIFLDDAFHNYRSLLEVHTDLLEKLHDRQSKQHPQFGTVSDLLLDAALNWQDAYMEYVTHYPISKAKVQEEQQRNPRFAAFLEVSEGHVGMWSHRSGLPKGPGIATARHLSFHQQAHTTITTVQPPTCRYPQIHQGG
jgi:hypothetical protein